MTNLPAAPRPDVLGRQTAPPPRDVEVTGPVTDDAPGFVGCSDTDVMAKRLDVVTLPLIDA